VVYVTHATSGHGNVSTWLVESFAVRRGCG
jgi:hypothetical protein